MNFLSCLVIVTLMLFECATVDAQVLCATKAGGVNLRSACKKSEKAVDLVSLGSSGPQGPQGPQGPKGDTGAAGKGESMKLVDANNAVIGRWYETVPNKVFITVNDEYISVTLNSNGQPVSDTLYYGNPNCLGDGLVSRGVPTPRFEDNVSNLGKAYNGRLISKGGKIYKWVGFGTYSGDYIYGKLDDSGCTPIDPPISISNPVPWPAFYREVADFSGFVKPYRILQE